MQFCPDIFWDSSLSWNTDSPTLSICFQETVLVYLPLVLLLLLTPLQVISSLSLPRSPLPFSVLTALRSIFLLLLVTFTIVELGATLADNALSPVYPSSAGVRIVTYLVALSLHVLCHGRGQVSSGVLFSFWLIASICCGLGFGSVVSQPFSGNFTKYVTQLAEFPLVFFMFVFSCWADTPQEHGHPGEADVESPELKVSFLSRLLFSWVTQFAWKGWKLVLKIDDFWKLDLENRCLGVVPSWDKVWKKASSEAGTNNHVSVLPVILRTFGPQYLKSSILQLIYTFLQLVPPQIVNLLISYISSNIEPTWTGYLYVVLIVCVTFINTILFSAFCYIQDKVGVRIRTALTSAIYRKTFKLSNNAKIEHTVGDATNLIAIDTQKFIDVCLYLNQIWASPLLILLSLINLYQILGPSSLAGFALMVLLVPINTFVVKSMKKYQTKQMNEKDSRIKLMDEILNGIKVLKLYAWENPFSAQVISIREREISSLKTLGYLQAFVTFLFTCIPYMVALVSFGCYVLVDPSNVLDAQTAFVSLTLFNVLRIPLNLVPQVIGFMVQCAISLRRVDKFLNSDEMDHDNVSNNPNEEFPIVCEDATFTWNKNNQRPTLSNINLKVKKGSLVAVVGRVGAGKSSLISSLMGELKRTGGIANVSGDIAYASQQAWLQNATVKENIIFGQPENDHLYKRVLETCALETDLQMLPGGDHTEIGEKGINLSGGQKQRISVARTVYSNSSLYLLDDPLSAVDSHVGKHMFDNVIGPNGLLMNKTRILVTHSVGFLHQVDQIVVIKDGEISETGTYSQLLANKAEFAEFLIEHLAENQDLTLDPETESELEGLKVELESAIGAKKLRDKLKKSKSNNSSKRSALTTVANIGREKLKRVDLDTAKLAEQGNQIELSLEHSEIPQLRHGTRLIEAENMELGGVKMQVYLYYFTSIGLPSSIAILFFYVIYQSFTVGANIWLSQWSDDPLASTDIAVRNMYLGVYGVLGLGLSLGMLGATALLMVGTLNAATILHQNMLKRIIRSPMSFFETTPLGRIINRFSKDVDIVDNTIPMNFRGMMSKLFDVIGSIFIIIFSMPIFAVVVIPIFIAYYFLYRFYVATTRQTKRMESVTRSPIYTHFSETMTGSTTIKMFRRKQDFIDQNETKVDVNQICNLSTLYVNRWLAIRLECIGNIIVLFTTLFAVITRGTIDPGVVGLCLSYALNISGAFNWLTRQMSEVETNLVSVERIKEYQEVPQEAPYELPENNPASDWPQYGVIKFDNYQVRYREGLDLVLKGVDLNINRGEKIGIVGRTGAGKSSLTLALFRIIEAAAGSIYIDDINITHLGLARLRSGITIIPQDPVLFSGTLRLNLDPLDQYSDKDVWHSLQASHLSGYVSSLPGGLQHIVAEGGSNLSLGQRQLVCLARALLRKTQVLVLDEATAAVDLETDDIVQATIREEFNECTVLTIAHRLNTIMDSSRVMVLDQGLVKEFDSPTALLADRKSIFFGMAKDAGLVE